MKDKVEINQAAVLAGVVGQVGCLIVFIIFIALGAGLLLDKFLNTKAIFTVLFMVGSVPISLYLTVRMSLTAVSRAQKSFKVDKEDMEENTEI